MNTSTREMYESYGFSPEEIEKIDKRTKQLPNLLLVKTEEDKKFSSAMQKLVARGLSVQEAKAEIRRQIATL